MQSTFSSESLLSTSGKMSLHGSLVPARPPEGGSSWSTRQPPTRDDWDRLRPTITKLYMGEQKTLSEVESIMAEKHNFHATTRMYKTRVKAWMLHKHSKRHEVVAISQKKGPRDAAGSRAASAIRGRPVDMENPVRYCSSTLEYGSRWYDPFLAQSGGVGFSTRPHPIPSPSLSPPLALLVPEQFFKSINTYLCNSISTQFWTTDTTGQLVTAKPSSYPLKDPGDILAQCSSVFHFYSSKSFLSLRHSLAQIFALIRTLIVAQDPRTLECFLAALVYLTRRGMHDIATMLRRYISQMAATVLENVPSSSPWREVCHRIGALDTDDFALLLDIAYDSVVNTFQQELGAFHRQTIACRVEAIHTLHNPNNLSAAEEQLASLLTDCTLECGLDDWRTQYVMVSLGWNLNLQQRCEEAEAMGLYAVTCAPDFKDSTTVIRRLELLGDCQEKLGKRPEAEASVRATIDTITRTRGRADPWAVENMIRLERWLRRWERVGEAEDLNLEISALLRVEDES